MFCTLSGAAANVCRFEVTPCLQICFACFGSFQILEFVQCWDSRCEFVPRLPRETKVDVRLCHACHAKWRGWAGFGAGAPRHFAWQAWHKLTSTFGLRGRRGTNSHLPSFCVAGVALMALGGALGPGFGAGAPRHFAWQAWHNLTSTFVSRGRRGTNSHLLSQQALCVAGVAQPDIHLRFTWQAWHKLTSTFVSRGRRGTHGTGWRAWTGLGACDAAALCVAGVAQPDIHLRFTLAGVAQTHIYLRFTWQAWHSWHWVARLDWLGRLWRRGTLRGRRGTNSHLLSVCVAGVAQTHIYCRFAWQAWHLWYWVAPLGRDLAPGRRATLRGRRGTTWHPPSFHVAGVAQTHIYCRFAWQACHLWYWVAPLGRDLAPGRRATLRGRRGTIWHPPSFHVAGVAQTHIHRRFAWQACHLWYWVAPRPGAKSRPKGATQYHKWHACHAKRQ